MKQLITDTIKDLVGSFLYYDRKEDRGLGIGDIQKAVSKGVITKQEIADLFKKELFDKL